MKIILFQNLSTGQQIGLVGLGGLYWGLAALTIRHGPQLLFGDRAKQIATFGSMLPVSYGLIRLTESILSLSPRNRLITTSVLSASALLLDGVAMMWFPDEVYENPHIKRLNPTSSLLYSRMGASAILWGVGVSLTIALITNTAF